MFVHDCQSKNMNFTREKEREREIDLYINLINLSGSFWKGNLGLKG